MATRPAQDQATEHGQEDFQKKRRTYFAPKKGDCEEEVGKTASIYVSTGRTYKKLHRVMQGTNRHYCAMHPKPKNLTYYY